MPNCAGTVGLTDWLGCLINWLVEYLPDWLTDCLTNWLTGWLHAWLTEWRLAHLTGSCLRVSCLFLSTAFWSYGCLFVWIFHAFLYPLQHNWIRYFYRYSVVYDTIRWWPVVILTSLLKTDQEASHSLLSSVARFYFLCGGVFFLTACSSAWAACLTSVWQTVLFSLASSAWLTVCSSVSGFNRSTWWSTFGQHYRHLHV